MQKRGQATVFIIVGLVVVLIVVGLIVFRQELFVSQWEKEQAEALIIPEQAEEIHTYVYACVEEVVGEGLDLLGAQGGYVNIPEDPIPAYGQNIFSNSLEIFKGSGARTAYWFYEAANGVEHDQVPTVDEMELELADYINDNLVDCVDNDVDILQGYNMTASGEVFTTVEILDQEVFFTINYPVSVAIEDFYFIFPVVYYDIDIPLGEMYDTANDIMDTENEEFIFEELTIDMLVLNEETPVSGAGFGCEEREWEYDNILESFKETLFYNSLAIKVKSTNYDVNTESEERYFELDLIGEAADVNANIMFFQNWPLALEVYPMEDGILTEDSYTDGGTMSGFLSTLFCLTNYNFIYDIKYPLLVSLYDADSDFTFQFATQVVLDNNQPRENTEGTFDFETESIICDSLAQEMTVYALEVDPSGALVELEGAEVKYQCVTSECDIGLTSGVRGSASLITLFPQCYNGQLIAEKDGYYRGSEIVSSIDTTVASVVLEKIYELNYEILVVDYDGNVRDLDDDETVYLSLTEEEGYGATANYPYIENTVELIPGTYSIFATLIKEGGGVSVNGQSFEKCVSAPMMGIGGIFGLERDKCYDVDLDDVDLDSMMTGGLELTWETDRYELDSASKITFYVLEAGVPESVDELEEVYSSLETGIGMIEPELE
jgi:hypothetical protein